MTRDGPPGPAAARRVREAEQYDEGEVWAVSDRWHRRVLHVFESPNTQAGEARFRRALAERAPAARALDVGCGRGSLTVELHDLGAASVYAFDVSASEIAAAQSEHGALDGVSFHVHGAEEPIEGEFDLIAGRSVLHHLDFRRVIPNLYANNLAPGGRMVFMEPTSHPLTLAFHRLVRAAHTDDEWPLTPADVDWLKREFGARVAPINLASFPAGIVSSYAFSEADNPLTRAAGRFDRAIERRPRAQARGRQGIVVIER